ncbi:unnamed protein product [Parascedosporium putredinis]|uniref:Uncharacterized protein n=1 Tax=Parascedosporium putredinis TaxID=1442378 RepID=A0A9P1HCQ1_9PEZI|nr:unnamed protein product [Parascedosporium putredinis]CAI8004956.1 unnamed protein product [Parascedosporium putredinis]
MEEATETLGAGQRVPSVTLGFTVGAPKTPGQGSTTERGADQQRGQEYYRAGADGEEFSEELYRRLVQLQAESGSGEAEERPEVEEEEDCEEDGSEDDDKEEEGEE